MTVARTPATTPERTQIPLGRWLPGMLGLAVIWGSSFVFIKVGVSELPPLYVALGRVASGALALLAVLVIRRDRLPSSLRVWAHNVVVAVVGIAAPFTLFAYGEQRIPSVVAGLWNSTTPLVVLPMAVWVFRIESMSLRRVIGLVLGFVGALTILGIWHGAGHTSLAGQLMCLAAACCYGISIPYTRRFLAPLPNSGVAMSAAQLIAASVLLAVVSPVVTGQVPNVPALSWSVVASVVTLGALGTGLAFVINMRNIRLVGASTASMVTYLIPVFATVLGVLVLHEHLRWYQPVGAAIVLAGVAVSEGLLFGGRASSRAAPRGPAPEPIPAGGSEHTSVTPVSRS